MVGRLQGTCGEIGGKAATVIIIMRLIFGLRSDLLLTTFMLFTSRCGSLYCVSVFRSRNHNPLARN